MANIMTQKYSNGKYYDTEISNGKHYDTEISNGKHYDTLNQDTKSNPNADVRF